MGKFHCVRAPSSRRAHEPEGPHLATEELEEDHLVQSACPVLGFEGYLEMTISTHSVGGGQLLRAEKAEPPAPADLQKWDRSWRQYQFCPF
ncbi:hypothetical protein MC885_021514 [Smutsia gigantea]|nr:hypothetical protein MC885_021514 [Smutsia gigantea]